MNQQHQPLFNKHKRDWLHKTTGYSKRSMKARRIGVLPWPRARMAESELLLPDAVEAV